ncbi:coiled-coil domain-containing protein 57 isoform X4 [Agelaius phoeniceus]|uniref:coiled-coil domain-containing protein 57 isoform X4 n=1 Tax=Agelaius phoeniceus TaxID=39638 RepID=UPI00405534B3
MAQVLAVFWEKGVLLNETGAPKERARAHTKQRRGCCVRVVRTERGECEEERTRCRFLEANAMRGTEKQEGRQTGAGTASVSEGRSGGGCGPSAAAPWRRVRPRRAPPAAARAACSRERSRAGVRAVRTPVATGLFHRKTARSHGIPLCRRSKQQLSLAAEREWILKQSKMQAELNWQQLCENAECNWYQKSEDPTHSLSSSREEIFQYDDESSLYKYIPALEIKKLQEQNASLRAAIAQMRKEMESLDEQMLSSLPQTEGRQLAEQGSLNTNKISTGTTPSNIKVSSTKLDCLVNPDTEEGPEPKVLEENMVNFGQQPADVGTGNGCQYSVKHTLQGMQNKLKEAARKISILSQEKRQLIEMGNRLRAELGMVLKEGVWHPVSSKHCTVCVASGSLLPRELVKRTQCQLSVLKHLQHRLTTQELQCTRQQHPSRFSSLTACSSLKEEEAPSSCGEETELPSSEVWIDFSIENHGPDTFSATKEDTTTEIVQTQLLSQSPSHVQQVQLSSSRMQNFCQILDTGSSHSLLSPRKNTSRGEFEVVHSIKQSEEFWQNVKAKDKLETSAEDLTVRGTRLEVQQKLKSRSLFCAHLLKPKISSSMTKIRNYNIKD